MSIWMSNGRNGLCCTLVGYGGNCIRSGAARATPIKPPHPWPVGQCPQGFWGLVAHFSGRNGSKASKASRSYFWAQKGDSGVNIGPKACIQRPRLTQQCSPGMGPAPASLNGPLHRRSTDICHSSRLLRAFCVVRNAISKSRAH